MRFAMVGTGWRAGFYARIAARLPQRFELIGAVARSSPGRSFVASSWGVPAFSSLSELLSKQRPDAIVIAVPREATPEITIHAVAAGIPVLIETPPAGDLDGLNVLWSRIGTSELVQVAEHSPFMPAHAARAAVVAAGHIGVPTQVQISSTHDYHAVAMIRRLLGIRFEEARITAVELTAPLLDPRDRDGWTTNTDPRPATNTVAILDFDTTGKSGIYDFTDNQWHNPLRANRIIVRGSRGEITDDLVTRQIDAATITRTPFVRQQSGIEQNLDGFDLEHISYGGTAIYRNPFDGARFSDDEIAVATLLDRMSAWVNGITEAGPYPLAEGNQDQLLALAIHKAATTKDAVLVTAATWGD